ncbi:MAG: ROK family protein, partial [Maribacter sp.]
MAQEVVLGIDIGGSLTKAGLVTKDGTILAKTVFKTEAKRPFPNFIEKLKLEVESLILESGSAKKILSVGVGAPNANPHTGQIENPPNLKWGPATPISKVINQTFKLPVSLANDANAAALGEMCYGAAKGMKNFVTLT